MMISDQYEIILCSDNIAAMIMLTRAPAASHFMIASSDTSNIFNTNIIIPDLLTATHAHKK